jgi:hypothetical protein
MSPIAAANGASDSFGVNGIVRANAKSRQFALTLLQAREVIRWQAASASVDNALAAFDHVQTKRVVLYRDGDVVR